MKRVLFVVAGAVVVLGGVAFFLSHQAPTQTTQNPAPSAPQAATSTLANPAAVFCTQHGGTTSSTTTPDGAVGLCSFSSGASCDEWALFRGECDVDGVSTSGAFTDGSTTIRMVYRTEGSFLRAAALGFDHLDMTVATSGSGARYLSTDGAVEFWEHQGTATIHKGGALLFEGDLIDQTAPAAGD